MKSKTSHTSYQHQRGTITDNHLKALVTDKLFRSRLNRNIKGKGSYAAMLNIVDQGRIQSKIAA